MERTPSQRLADELLDGGLDAFVADRRADGAPWRVIARELYAATDGKVDVTPETVRAWYAATVEAVAS